MSPRRTTRAFSLVELLVVLAIIALLVSIVAVAARFVRGSAISTRETALARQLMHGYIAYATDHRGELMPGYYGLNPALPALDEQGTALTGQTAARFPWRLAPALDYRLDGLVQDRWLLEDLRYTNQFAYFVSLYPSLGLNSTFIGGDSSAEGLGFNSANLQTYGNFYLTRLSQAKRPVDLIVFGSSRTNAPYEPGAPPIIEGYFRIESPWLFNRRWDLAWTPDDPAQLPKKWGFLSMRLGNRQAAFAFLDGHTGLLDDGQVQDMRRWADVADRPDWTLTAP